MEATGFLHRCVLAFPHHLAENFMRFDYKTYHIDCTARHDEDGNYYAHARITRMHDNGLAHAEVFDSGPLDGFSDASDALHCARSWAIEWCDEAVA